MEESKQEIIEIPGLNDKEIAILLHIIDSPKNLSLSELERITSLPKTTIHRTIDSLVKKGLAVWQLGTQGKEISKGNYSNYINQLKQRQNELENFITKLKIKSENTEISYVRPTIKYYEGIEGIKQLIWNTLDAEDELLVYTNIMRQDVVGKKWLTDYCMKFIERDIQDQVLCDTKYAKDSYQRFGGRQKYFSPIEKFYQKSMERVMKSPLMTIKGETYIYNNIFSTYSVEGDILVGCEIQSKDISSTQKAIFENLWSQTSEIDSIDKF